VAAAAGCGGVATGLGFLLKSFRAVEGVSQGAVTAPARQLLLYL
jgi:hypothetical protein